ncbi:MAG: hypothetical protein AAF747_05720 [Planctomycetota bacterium]
MCAAFVFRATRDARIPTDSLDARTFTSMNRQRQLMLRNASREMIRNPFRHARNGNNSALSIMVRIRATS